MADLTYTFMDSLSAAMVKKINSQLGKFFDRPDKVTTKDSGIIVTLKSRLAGFLIFEQYKDSLMYNGRLNKYIGQKYIAWVFVMEAFRGQGIFKTMMLQAQSQYSLIVLHEDSTDKKLLESYEKLGFVVVPEYTRLVSQEQEDGSEGQLEQYFMVWQKS